MKYIMKYLLILIGWIVLTAYLIIERVAKAIISLNIIVWDWRIARRDHRFWSKVHVITPFALFSIAIVFDSIRSYYRFKLGPDNFYRG